MARYQGADATFDVPNDWEDKSIVAFSAPPKPSTLVPNVVLTKDKLKPNESLEQYVDRTIVEMAKQLAAFKLLSKEERALGPERGLEIQFTWNGSAGKTVVQRIVMALGPGKTVVGLNVTCDQNDAKKLEPISDRIVQSLRVTPPTP